MSDALAKDTAIVPELTIEREFSHPPERVFAAWTSEEALRQWMGAGRSSRTPVDHGGASRRRLCVPDAVAGWRQKDSSRHDQRAHSQSTLALLLGLGSGGRTARPTHGGDGGAQKPPRVVRAWCCIKPTSSTKRPAIATTMAGAAPSTNSRAISRDDDGRLIFPGTRTHARG